MIKLFAIMFLLLTTCAEQARFYGDEKKSCELDNQPVPPIQPPLMVGKPGEEDQQDCEEELQDLKLKYGQLSRDYKNLQYKYRKLYRRHSYHMKKYHYD